MLMAEVAGRGIPAVGRGSAVQAAGSPGVVALTWAGAHALSCCRDESQGLLFFYGAEWVWSRLL